MSRPLGRRPSDSDEQTLGAILADAVARLRAGERPRAAEYIARHPRLEGEIIAHFETLAAVEGLGPSAAGPPRIDAALSALGGRLQRSIVLRHGEGRTWQAIAAELGEDEIALRREYADALLALIGRGSDGDGHPRPQSRGGG